MSAFEQGMPAIVLFDQAQAQAIEALRKARGFVLFTANEGVAEDGVTPVDTASYTSIQATEKLTVLASLLDFRDRLDGMIEHVAADIGEVG